MSGETKLLPCPFCGSAWLMGQEPHDNGSVAGMWYLYHDYGPLGSAARKCGVTVQRHFRTAEDAATFWNSRDHHQAETDAPCPICKETFKPDDLCATDIELGTCHAACLEGCPTVDLETGDPVDGPIPTFRYDEVPL